MRLMNYGVNVLTGIWDEVKMKTRNGFVSNSSSSSYIVTIRNVDFFDFCYRFSSEYKWSDFFSVDFLEREINERIDRINDTKDESTSETFKMFPKMWLKDLNDQKEKLSKIDKDNFIEIARFVFDYNNITCIEDSDDLVLHQSTSMHNDFNSGMCELMKEIVLYLMFETDYKIICGVEAE